MKKSWLAGIMAAALTVSMLAGCSSNSSGATETKEREFQVLCKLKKPI